MGDVAKEGRTVLFVSHNMAAITSLCSKVYLLNEGRLAAEGDCHIVIGEYMKRIEQALNKPLTQRTDRVGNRLARITSVQLQDQKGDVKKVILAGGGCHIVMGCEVLQPIVNARFLVGIYDYFDRQIALLDTYVTGQSFTLHSGYFNVVCSLPVLPLFPGQYALNLAIMTGDDIIDHLIHGGEFFIEASDFFGTGKLPEYGPLLIQHAWSLRNESAGT
jgi:lipopolysaccharide transport system ATP-binding protein